MRHALDLVGEGDDPLLAAVLKGSVSWHLLVSGRFDEAERVAARTAACRNALSVCSIPGCPTLTTGGLEQLGRARTGRRR